MKIRQASVITASILFALTIPNGVSKESNIDELPSLEMLEFLGNFETDDGIWVDPMELEDLLDKTEETEQMTEQEK